jgi:hypothetical protein
MQYNSVFQPVGRHTHLDGEVVNSYNIMIPLRTNRTIFSKLKAALLVNVTTLVTL